MCKIDRQWEAAIPHRELRDHLEEGDVGMGGGGEGIYVYIQLIFESSLHCKEINLVNPKGNQPE